MVFFCSGLDGANDERESWDWECNKERDGEIVELMRANPPLKNVLVSSPFNLLIKNILFNLTNFIYKCLLYANGYGNNLYIKS